jgi:hypothetical protein
MLLILVTLVVVMALAGLVTAFAALPGRDRPIPHAQRLSRRMHQIRDRIEP